MLRELFYMRLIINESDYRSCNLTFEKLQADQYDILCNGESVGTIYCRSYYSNPRNRVWTVFVELDSFKVDDTASSVADAKNVAKRLWRELRDKVDRWNRSMESDV